MMKKVELEKKDILRLFESKSRSAVLWRSLKKLLKQFFIIVILFFAAFFLINGNAFIKRWQYNSQKNAFSQISPTPTFQATPVPAQYEPKIVIEKLKIEAPIILDVDNEDMTERLKEGVAHMRDSAYPSQVGNVVLVGHSSDYPWSNGRYKTIFALLDKLKENDEIKIYFGTQIMRYQVTGAKIVKPTDLSVVAMTEEPRLTLLTCYPVGTSLNRLIVTAKLIEGQTYSVQLNQPYGDYLPRIR